MKRIITVLCLTLFLGTTFGQSKELKSLSAHEFEQLLKDKKVQLVDVRTPDEYQSGHIKGAKNINIGDPVKFEAEAAKLNKKVPVAVYCRSGRRSKIAGQRLIDKGFVVYDLNQGILEWTNSGKSVE